MRAGGRACVRAWVGGLGACSALVKGGGQYDRYTLLLNILIGLITKI